MARSEARIFTSIWSDEDFRDLDRTAQHIYFMALSQPTLNLCGVTLYIPTTWSNNARDLSAKMVQAAVRTLVERRYFVIDPATSELWIRTFVRHDRVLDKPNVAIGMTRDFSGILSPIIRAQFLDALGERLPERLVERFGEGFWERLAEPFRERFAERFGIACGRAPLRVRSLQPPASANATSLQPRADTDAEPPPAANGHARTREGDSDQGRDRDQVPRTGTEGPGPTGALPQRLLDACRPRRKDTAAVEAANVIRWALEHVTPTLVDEAIGWAEGLDKPLSLPRGVAPVIQAKASDAGIAMPDYDPRSLARVL